MQEIVFQLVVERPGHLEARAEGPDLRIAAASLEELQHEAREALINHFGAAHCAYRVQIRRQHSDRISGIRPLRRPPARCG